MARGGIVAVATALGLAAACGGESRRQDIRATMGGNAGNGTGGGAGDRTGGSAGNGTGVAGNGTGVAGNGTGVAGNGTGGAGNGTGGAGGAGGLAAAEGGEGATAGAPECLADDDCVAVFDTHQARVNCYHPTPASREEAASDPCLIPWLPNPKCSLPEPEPSCVLPLDPVLHSCPATPKCVAPRCVAGSCSLDWEGCVPVEDHRDCETRRTEYVALLELARGCDPTQDPPSCYGSLADTCGCELSYDGQGPYAQRVWCAFEAWRDAGCGIVECGQATCTKGGDAVCRANGDGTGTCEYPGSP